MSMQQYTAKRTNGECSGMFVPLGMARVAELALAQTPSLVLDGFIGGDSKLVACADGKNNQAELESQTLQSYFQSGIQFLAQLRGSFVLTLWDPSAQRLVVAVDPMGTRSVYYAVFRDTLYFSTRLGQLAGVEGLPRKINHDCIYFYLNHSFVPAPYTIYEDISRLEPGSCLIWQKGKIAVEQYWDLAYPEEHMKEDEAAQLVASSVEEAVSFLLGQDSSGKGAAGAFLSGGTDSSTVVGLMSRLKNDRIKTFSVGFVEEKYNEIHYARVAAQRYNSIAYEYFVHPAEALRAVETIADEFDEPFGNSSALPTFFCVKMASEAGLDTLFAGDGGDELFGGNERYLTEKLFWYYQDLPAWARSALKVAAPRLPGIFPFAKIRNYVNKANLDAPARFYAYQLYYRDHDVEFLTDNMRSVIDRDFPLNVPRRHFARCGEASPLNKLLYLDLKLAVGDNDLFKVNRMAESQGIEVRYPFLDKQVAMVAARIPTRLKLKGWSKRYIFKKAFAQLLPEEILRKKKHGFGLPTGEWLRSDSGFRDLSRSLLLDSKSIQRGYFKKASLERLFRDHDQEPSGYFGSHIWNFMMLELWHRRHFDPSARNSQDVG